MVPYPRPHIPVPDGLCLGEGLPTEVLVTRRSGPQGAAPEIPAGKREDHREGTPRQRAGGAHCRNCGRNWTAAGQAHCRGLLSDGRRCCLHFTCVSAFDAHLRIRGDGESVEHRDPATIRTKAGGRRLVRRFDRFGELWGWPDMAPRRPSESRGIRQKATGAVSGSLPRGAAT